MRIVVIGGDAAGMSAASRVRKYSPDSEVVVYEAGSHVSYSACGMPYYVGGVVRDLQDLIHYPISKFIEERKIDVHINSRVTKIEPSIRQLTVSAEGETLYDKYDRLIIATGARARIPDALTGKENVHSLRHLDDLVPLENSLRDLGDIIIIGAGYVGLEMAEALRKRGKNVTVIQRSSTVLRGLEEQFTSMVVKELEQNGVKLVRNAPIEKTKEENGRIISIFAGGEEIKADAVFVATGVIPNSELAIEAGIKIGSSGAISVNEHMQTSLPGIYAAGDVATSINMVTGKESYFPLATGSNRSGRIAGENAAGVKSTYSGIAGTEVVKVFSLEVGRTGLDEAGARENGFNPVSATITSTSRASYYPGAAPLKIKLVADSKSHRLLGGVMIGKEGVSKRLDVIAIALYSKLKVEDMTKVDYSYSPPFAPAWEPMGVAADVLLGKLN